MADLDLGDGEIFLDGKPMGIAPLTITFTEAKQIARDRLEMLVARCVCGWFDQEDTFQICPRCGTDLDLLTQWWREMDDRFWGMSKEELREDFETWRVLSSEFVTD